MNGRVPACSGASVESKLDEKHDGEESSGERGQLGYARLQVTAKSVLSKASGGDSSTRTSRGPAMSVIADESSPATSEKPQAASEDADVSLGPDTVIYGGEDKLPPPPDLTAGEERRLWRKIDMRFMPTMTMLYLVSFLDRSNIGESRSDGAFGTSGH